MGEFFPLKKNSSASQVDQYPLSTKAPMLGDTGRGNASKHAMEMKKEQSNATNGRFSLIPQRQSHRPQYPASFNSYNSPPQQGRGERPSALQKSRKFADAYNERQQGHHGGSSGSAKRVLDIFRRIGKQKEKEDLTLKHNVEPNPYISPSLLLEPTSSPLWTSWEGKSGSSPEQSHYDNPPPTLTLVPTPPLGSIADQIQQDAPSSLTRPKLVSPTERTSVVVEQKPVVTVKSSFPFVQSKQVGLMGKPSLPTQQKPVIATSKNTPCAKCGEKLSGQFVRNLGNAFHLECLTCAVQ